MNNLYYLGALANDYDCGTYGSGGFNENQCQTTAAPGTPDTGFGTTLSNPLFIIGTAMIIVAVVAFVVLRARRRHSN